MQRALSVGLVILSGGLGLVTLHAQEEENPPRETTEEESPVTPPPAWKSVEVGNFYLKLKKLKGALSRFQEAVKTDPHYAPARLLCLENTHNRHGGVPFAAEEMDAACLAATRPV